MLAQMTNWALLLILPLQIEFNIWVLSAVQQVKYFCEWNAKCSFNFHIIMFIEPPYTHGI